MCGGMGLGLDNMGLYSSHLNFTLFFFYASTQNPCEAAKSEIWGRVLAPKVAYVFCIE